MSGIRNYWGSIHSIPIRQFIKKANSNKKIKLLLGMSLLSILLCLFVFRIIAATESTSIDQTTFIHFAYLSLVGILTFQLYRQLKNVKKLKRNAAISDLQFGRLYDSGLMGLLFVNLEGKVLKANDAFLNMIGYTREDMESGIINWNNLTPDEYKSITAKCVSELKSSGVCIPFEKEYICKNGSRINVLLGSAMLTGTSADEAITYVIDITDKIKAAGQVQLLNKKVSGQKEELLRLLMNAPAMISLRRGPDLRLEYMNAAAIAYTGSSDHIGLTSNEISAKYNESTGNELLVEVYRTGKRFSRSAFPFRFDKNRDGVMDNAWFDLVLEPMLDEHGNIEGVASFGYDVTAFIKANADIKESEERFRFLADSLQHKIWICDPDGRAVYYNKGWYDYLKANTIDDLNSGIWKALHPDDREIAESKWKDALNTGDEIELEQRYRNNEGAYEWHLTRCCAHKNSEGEVIRWIGSSTNIQEMKKALETAELLSRNKDEFISIASHELKTPLTTMQGSLHILSKINNENFNSENLKKFVGLANKQFNRLNEIVNDLLEVQKIEGGKMELVKSEFNLHDILNDAVQSLPSSKVDQDIQINSKLQINIYADQKRIRQVIVKLLTNALKYSSAGKRTIKVDITQIGKDVKLAVTDQGIGIEVEKQNAIFEKFSRVHNSSQLYAGLGLGLFISAEIIRCHDGEMGLISEKNHGSTFWFQIPIYSRTAS